MTDAPAHPVPSADPAPADLVPEPSRRARLLWYVGTMALTAALVTVGMRVWDRDLHAPFFYDLDSLLYLPLVKTLLETGSIYETERLGAPGIQELYDFPIIDHLHFAALRAFGAVLREPLLAYNAYSLFAYPLTALTMMWALRWLKLTLPAAALGGILYAFLPYHQERYHYHYFLALYYWVPVSLIPALALMRGTVPFFAPNGDGTFRRALVSRTALLSVLCGIVTASAGAYYAFFACACYGFAGLYAWIALRTYKAMASAVLLVVPVFVTGLAYHFPTYVYQWKNGANVITERVALEADLYGLKLAHLLLPGPDHNVAPLANLRTRFSSPDRPSEGETAGSLGVVGAAGLLALIAPIVLPVRRSRFYEPLGALALFLVLLGTIGAFGSLFNLIVSPQIRAYNRLCVFVAVPVLAAAVYWLDKFTLTRTGPRARTWRAAALAGVLVIGYFDETPWGWNPLNPKGMAAVDKQAQRYRADRDFFARAEALVPPGTRVFCLPYVPYPEFPPVHKMGNYEHARGYLMTDTLHWSYGAIKRRETDMWQRDVEGQPPHELLQRIVVAGFDALFIDGRGYSTRPDDRVSTRIANFNKELQRVAPGAALLPMVVHEDGQQYFLDLRPYRKAFRAVDETFFQVRAQVEREWVAPLWLAGFQHVETPASGERYIWGARDGTLVLVNPTDRTRTFEMSFAVSVNQSGAFQFVLSGAVDAEFTLERPGPSLGPDDDRRHGERKKFTVVLPPGRTRIRFRLTPPDTFQSTFGAPFYLQQFRLTEK
jgi:hypothetical protein